VVWESEDTLNLHIVVGHGRNHNFPVGGTDWRPLPGLQSNKVWVERESGREFDRASRCDRRTEFHGDLDAGSQGDRRSFCRGDLAGLLRVDFFCGFRGDSYRDLHVELEGEMWSLTKGTKSCARHGPGSMLLGPSQGVGLVLRASHYSPAP
jgi:hypothetical protein